MVEEIRLCGIGAAGAYGFMCWGMGVERFSAFIGFQGLGLVAPEGGGEMAKALKELP